MSHINFEEFTYLSSNGKTTIHAYIWNHRDITPRIVIQLSHGMCEYVERYDLWARRFAEHGIVFCGNDHLGHGHTAPDEEELGFTAPRGGADLLVEDLHTMTAHIKKRFGNIPLILYGHSMGSFAARLYLSRYGEELNGAIISGTAGPEQPTGLALKLVHIIQKAKGNHHRSKFLTSLAFGSYNKKFSDENDAFSWLTRAQEVRNAYGKDRFCRFIFTTAGYETLFALLHNVSDPSWAENVPKHLPILMFAGDMDPVGNYGKGVKKVYDRLKKEGCNVTLKLYRDARHEMHNENNCNEVFDDIMHFIAKIPTPLTKQGETHEF